MSTPRAQRRGEADPGGGERPRERLSWENGMGRDPTTSRPLNSHCFTVRLTVFGQISRSHCHTLKSHCVCTILTVACSKSHCFAPSHYKYTFPKQVCNWMMDDGELGEVV